MLKCQEFIEKLEKNEITDFSEYIENATIEYLVPMARHGIEVDNLLKRGEETIVKTSSETITRKNTMICGNTIVNLAF